MTSNALQLSSVPDRIFIVVRKRMTLQGPADSNSFFAIKQISANFNNLSGILSGASPNRLFELSRRNGSNQSLYEFLGEASVGSLNGATVGSILVIRGTDLQLPDYLAPGSIGQFSLQFQLAVQNLDTVDVQSEMMIITETNKLFISQNGQSFKQTSLLTKDIVMNETMAQHGESESYIESFMPERGNIKNVPLLNYGKKSGSGAPKSGGAMSGGGAFGQSYMR